jgi:ribonuclease Z
VLGLGYYDLGFDVQTVELEGGDAVMGEDFTVRAVEVEHTVPALGYVFEENPMPGRFMPNRAKELGVPEGPLFARLQGGQAVTVGGKVVGPESVMGPQRAGLKMAYSGDTRPCARLLEAVRGADLLVHEATVASDLKEKAKVFGHSTAEEAGRFAAEAGIGKLYLVHFSGRYEDPAPLLEEARRYFPESYLGVDLLTVEVRRH